jgi:hypothetical protein
MRLQASHPRNEPQGCIAEHKKAVKTTPLDGPSVQYPVR